MPRVTWLLMALVLYVRANITQFLPVDGSEGEVLTKYDRFELQAESILCCKYLDEHISWTASHVVKNVSETHFLQCINNYAAKLQTKPLSHQVAAKGTDISLISYATPDIMRYAAYAYAVNGAYAALRGYLFHLSFPSNGFQFESRDQRWNKIRILEEVLTNFVQYGSYLVWLDADLIFVDFGFSFEEIIRAHPSADIIMSRDSFAESGIANTGCMIVKHTVWSLTFLSEWWNAWDRAAGMDQHVFDYLWKKYDRRQNPSIPPFADINRHIVLLEPDAINSYFPVAVHHRSHNRILHLAGESDAARAQMLETAMQSLCSAVAQIGDMTDEHNTLEKLQMVRRRLPLQLGMTSSFLRQFNYRAVMFRELEGNLNETRMHCERQVNGCTASDVDQVRESLRNLLLSRSKAGANDQYFLNGRVSSDSIFTAAVEAGNGSAALRSEHDALTDQIIECMQWAFDMNYILYNKLVRQFKAQDAMDNIEARNSELLPQKIVDQLQRVLDSGFELLVVMSEHRPNATLPVLQLMEPLIETTMKQLVGEASMGQALYYQFKVKEFYSAYHSLYNSHISVRGRSDVQAQQEELRALYGARSTWERMTSQYNYYGTGKAVSDPYREYALVLARIGMLECQCDMSWNGERISDVVHCADRRIVGISALQHSIMYPLKTWLPQRSFDKLLPFLSLEAKLNDSFCAERNDLCDLYSEPLTRRTIQLTLVGDPTVRSDSSNGSHGLLLPVTSADAVAARSIALHHCISKQLGSNEEPVDYVLPHAAELKRLRADTFSLGAYLCELLVPTATAAVIATAAAHDVKSSKALLDACQSIDWRIVSIDRTLTATKTLHPSEVLQQNGQVRQLQKKKLKRVQRHSK